MPELAAILEQEGRTVDLEPGHYDRLLRRRDRRRRNRRLGSALLAIAITAVTIGYAVSILHGRAERIPADRITSRNVGRLGLTWASAVTVDSGQSPVVRDRVVYANVGSGAEGFPLDCPSTDGSCRSTWSTSLGSSGPLRPTLGPILVGDRFVYASEDESHPTRSFESHRLDAFPRSCGADACDPAWISETGSVPMYPLAVVDGVVYVTRGDDLLAFAGSCGRPTCDPVWTAHGIGAPTFADDRVFVRSTSGLSVFSPACWNARGASCEPIWFSRTPGRPPGLHPTNQPQALSGGSQLPLEPLVVDGHVIVSDGRAIYSFAADCRGRCRPQWIGRVPGGPGYAPVVSDGLVFTAAQGGSDLFAFPLDCSSVACRPTWTGHTDDGVGFQPVVADGSVLVAGVLGNSLIAFPTTCSGDCSPAWTAPLDDSIAQAPTVSEDLVFVSGLSGLSAFRVGCSAPCPPVFRWEAPGSPQISPIVQGDSLAVVASDTLSVFRLQIGEPMTTTAPAPDRALPIGVIAIGLVLVLVIVAARRRRPTFP